MRLPICLIFALCFFLSSCAQLSPSYHRNQWAHIASHYQLDHYGDRASVRHELRFYERHQTYIHELTHNAKPYIYYVYQQTQKRHMPAELALLPMIESSYAPFLHSKPGAVGLWQIMPGTATGLGLRIDWWYDGRRDVRASTDVALDYLQYLHDYFGDWLLAIAAYDSGVGTVGKAVKYNRRHHRATDFWALPLPLETKNYVPSLLALSMIIKDPQAYHLTLKPVAYHPYFAPVSLHGNINLNRIAKLAATPVSVIRQLNPGYRRWTTHTKGTYSFLLPYDHVNYFQQQYAMQSHPNVDWVHHRVTAGQSLILIAHRYHTSAKLLKHINNIRGTLLHIGQELLVPLNYHGHLKHPDQQRGNIAEDNLPGPKQLTFTVQRGETLRHLAKRYHVKVASLRFWNHLTFHARVHPGQKLILWRSPRHHYHTAYRHYKIHSGDNLSTIAHRFHTSIRAIKHLNKLKSNTLHIGKKLRLPPVHQRRKHHYVQRANNQMVTHHVHPGETLYSIAHYYRIPTKELAHWNHLSINKVLSVGEKLHIYLHRKA